MQQNKQKTMTTTSVARHTIISQDRSLPQLKNDELVYSTPLDGAKLSPPSFSLSCRSALIRDPPATFSYRRGSYLGS